MALTARSGDSLDDGMMVNNVSVFPVNLSNLSQQNHFFPLFSPLGFEQFVH